ESGELPQIARRHAEYHRAVFARAESEWEIRSTTELLATYRPRIDDVRTALDWAFSGHGDVTLGIALTVAAIPLWPHLAMMGECRLRVEQAMARLDSAASTDSGLDMRLFLAFGITALHGQDPGSPKVIAALTTALELAERVDDPEYRLRAMWALYIYRFREGDYRNALTLAEQFRTVAATTPDHSDDLIGDRLIGVVLHVLGDQAEARRRIEP